MRKINMLAPLTFVLIWISLQAATISQRNSDHYNLDSSALLQRLQDMVHNSLEREDDEQHSSLEKDSKYDEQEDGDTSGSSGIFQSIMAQMMNGHVNAETISHWMSQIKIAMSRGTISSENVNKFIVTLKEKLAGTSFGDTCCPLG